MAKVKIYLEDGETIQDAEDSIAKALHHHNSGDVHHSHSFSDPAMVDLSQRLEAIHKKIYADMIEEISQTLDEDYLK